MTDNTQRHLLVMQLESLRRWRRDAWDAFEKTGDPRFHTDLLAADELMLRVTLSGSRSAITLALLGLDDPAQRHPQPLARLCKRLGLLGAIEGLHQCIEADTPQKFQEGRGLGILEVKGDGHRLRSLHRRGHIAQPSVLPHNVPLRLGRRDLEGLRHHGRREVGE